MGEERILQNMYTRIYIFTLSFLSQNLDRRLGNFINYEGNGERRGWYMADPRFILMADWLSSWPFRVAATRCRRITMQTHVWGLVVNSQIMSCDGIRDSGILACQTFLLFAMKWNGARVDSRSGIKEMDISINFLLGSRLKILPKFSEE